jgi:hypothetical protein
MKIFRTTLWILTVTFSVQTPETEASHGEEAVKAASRVSIFVYGKIKTGGDEENNDWVVEKLGDMSLTDENREAFRLLPLVGSMVVLNEQNKKWYDAVIYTQTDYVMKVGLTYGVIPKLRGENDAAVLRRMAYRKCLSFVNK